MKQLTLSLLFIALSSILTAQSNVNELPEKNLETIVLSDYITQLTLASCKLYSDTTKVFICDSDGATKYHLDKNCRGLIKCNHEVLRVTKSEATRKGKETLCGWED